MVNHDDRNQGGRKLGGREAERSFVTAATSYEVQHPFWDQNTYFLACLCLACVDDDDDEDDAKEVDARNDSNIGSTDQYEVQHPFWGENIYIFWRVYAWLVLN